MTFLIFEHVQIFTYNAYVISVLQSGMPSWVLMWTLAVLIFAGSKWLTWQRWHAQVPHAGWRSAAYLFAWPGMDPISFLESGSRIRRPDLSSWLAGASVTALGATLFFSVARTIPENHPLLQGWTGMLGLILTLHFGICRLAALLWRSLGVNAVPIMAAPLGSACLSEFWGRRWNRAFHQLAHDFVFVPLYRKLGARRAGFLVFLTSGLLHDLVISVPARGGFGLPTLYFVLQGAGVAIERSRIGKRLGLRRGIRGWLFMAAVTAGPAYWLFHPPFVLRVFLPFMKAVHAL